MAGLPIMLAVESLFDMALLNCRPSAVAAAILYAERRQRGAVPFWPSMLAKMTGYEDLTSPELAVAVHTAQKLCRKVLYTQIYKSQAVNLAAGGANGGGGGGGGMHGSASSGSFGAAVAAAPAGPAAPPPPLPPLHAAFDLRVSPPPAGTAAAGGPGGSPPLSAWSLSAPMGAAGGGLGAPAPLRLVDPYAAPLQLQLQPPQPQHPQHAQHGGRHHHPGQPPLMAPGQGALLDGLSLSLASLGISEGFSQPAPAAHHHGPIGHPLQRQ
jgi:hypothetical protein